MIKRVLKSALVLLISLSIALSIPTMASAARYSAVSISVGDEALSLTGINLLAQGGRIYAPYDFLFKALGATSTYNERSGKITAVSGDTKVIFLIDEGIMSVEKDGYTEDTYLDAIPIEDTYTGKVYIPIRYSAQAFGYVVGWDNAKRMITLDSLEDILDDSGASYTLMDKCLSYYSEFNAKPHAVSGSFDLTMDVYDEEYNPVTLTLSGSATGLIDEGGEEMNLQFTTNMGDFMNQLYGTGVLTDEEMAEYLAMDEIEFDIIVNNETGMLYMRSPYLSTYLGLEEGTWVSTYSYSAGFSDYAPYMPVDLTSGGSFRDIVISMLEYELLFDTGTDTLDMLDMINTLYSDQSFVKVGSNYTSTYTDTYEDYGYQTTYELTLIFDGDVFSGCSYSYTDDMEEFGVSTTQFSFDADGNMSYYMLEDWPDFINMEFDATLTFTDTTETPAREPESGSTIVSLEELYLDEEIEEGV